MSKYLYSNNAASLLTGNLTDIATSFSVTGGSGSLFPNPSAGEHFMVTLVDGSNNYEIVKVTGRSTDTFTIVRAQEGTVARSFSTGDKVELRVTAGGLGNNLQTDDIGTSVQGYDANTAKLNADQSWSGSQRGVITTDNDLSFDLNAANNFTCTPTAGGTLTFTNITAGQSGFIKLVNGSNYAIAAHTNTKVTTSFLTTVSATGTYIISYYSDGTNVFCATAGAMA